MLGRFASLAVADTVRMTSYYNNTISYYCMYKNIDKICIEKLYENHTQCKNGFEVQVSVSAPSREIYSAINQLMYFDKLFVNDIDINKELANKFNNRKIKNYGLYSLCSIYENSRDTIIRYGNVVYPISRNLFNLLDTCIDLNGLAINFDIGELDINPNRESLLANDRTLNAFSSKVSKLYKHLVNTYCLKDGNLRFDSISEFNRANNGYLFSVNHEKIDDIQYHFNISYGSVHLPRHTIKTYVSDVELNKGFVKYFDKQKRVNIHDSITGMLRYSQFTKNYSNGYVNLSLYDLTTLLDAQRTMFSNTLSNYDRKYIRQVIPYNYSSIVFIDKEKLNDILDQEILDHPSDADTLSTIKKLIEHANLQTIKTPDSFINDIKAEAKARRQKVSKQSILNIEEYIFYQFDHMSTYGNMIYHDRYRLSDLTEIKHTFIYGEKDDPLIIDVIKSPLYNILCNNKCRFILCAKKYLKLLEPLPNALNIFDFLYKYNGYMRSCARIYYTMLPVEWLSSYRMMDKIEHLNKKFSPSYDYARYDSIEEFLNRDDSNFVIQQMKHLYPISSDLVQQLKNILSIVTIKELTKSYDEIRLAMAMYCLHKLKIIQLSFIEISKIKLYLQNNLSTLNITLYENFSN